MSNPVDNQDELSYNRDQQNSIEERHAELQSKYIEALSSGNLEEQEKAERDIKIFLGDVKPDSEGESVGETVADTTNGGPETPPADNTKPDSEVQPQDTTGGETDESPGAKDGATTPSAEEEWLNSLDPSVRKIVEQRLSEERKAREYHEQRYRSETGRQAALQRKLEEERKARSELEQKLRDGAVSQPSNPTATPANTQTATSRKIQELNEKIAKLRGPDPELADLLETTRDALLETQQNISASVPKVDMSAVEELKAKIAKQEFEMVVNSERTRLEQMVPGALQVLDYVDPKTGWSPWSEFVNSLPPTLQQAANDANADTYAYLMPLYGQWAERYNAAHGYTQQPQQTTHNTQTEVDPRAAQVQQARQAKLTTSAAAPARSTPPPAHKPSLEERRKNPPPYGTPEYEALVAEVIKATQEGKL